jgi:transcriptional regulator with XRE-family HTH domain
MTFNHALIRHALNASGLHVAELAYRLDIAINTLDRLLDGEDDPGDLRIATLQRLAEHLGLPLQALFAAPHQPEPDADVPSNPTDDAATVIATIYDRGSTPTPNIDLTTSLAWDLDRLHAAYKEADRRLRPAGLRLARSHGEAAIVPLHDNTPERTRLAEMQAANKGLNMAHYKAVYALLQGESWLNVSDYNSTRRRLVAGVLINLGIFAGERATPTLSEAVTFGDPTAS